MRVEMRNAGAYYTGQPPRGPVGPAMIPPGIRPLGSADANSPNVAVLAWSALSTASMAASAYHGYKRNQSVGWAVGWGLMGALFPVFTPVVAVAQGFGKRKVGR